MTKKISILSTKKLLPNQKQLLLDANFSVTDEDFIEIRYKDFSIPNPLSSGEGRGETLIFTSQNAVQSILNHPKCEALIPKLREKNVFCVGLKTKALLEENGFKVIAHTGYASDLAEIISLIYPKEKYTFFSGNMRRDVLPNTLKENNIVFNEIEVYETALTPQKVNTKPEAILFFSPSAVESYLKLNVIKDEICFCIGETTAEALVPKLRDKKIKNIVIAEKPTVENVIAEVIEHYR
ncbi:MAG: uroporphyrinogen-III synthase [Flavobacterium sp.]